MAGRGEAAQRHASHRRDPPPRLRLQLLMRATRLPMHARTHARACPARTLGIRLPLKAHHHGVAPLPIQGEAPIPLTKKVVHIHSGGHV